MRIYNLVFCLLLAAAPALTSQAATPAPKPAQLQWGPAPAAFPKGAKMAVLKGNPAKAGQFTVELSFPAGYIIPPHSHPTDEIITVKKGVLLVGMGDAFDLANAKHMKVGQKGTIPTGQHHFAAASGATVITVSGKGPFEMTYVNPADDPRTPPAKS
jgi:quercetin dioxygenase-like cupin family protein